MLYQVALLGLKIPPLTYYSQAEAKLGSLVKVPLKNKTSLGIILRKEVCQPVDREIKEIKDVIIPEFLPTRLLRFYNFVSRYYFVYLGEVIALALPGIMKESFLTCAQAKHSSVRERSGRPYSGLIRPRWTRVYLLTGKREEDKIRFLLRKIEKRDGSILFLVPEIIQGERIFLSLREQLGDDVVFYHSALKKTERIKGWLEIREGKARVIIGPKQAIFLPIPNLTGIMLEEEESPFYKEEKRHFHYNARDCAVIRGKIENIPVYFFSDTPSVESFYNSQIGKYKLLGGFKRKRCKIIVAEKREEVLSSQLKRFLANYRPGEKFYLLCERQGFSRYILCEECGFIPRCSICGFPFFYHQAKSLLSCHICKKEEKVFDECPNCRGLNFSFKGIGIERVQREIERQFPHIKLILTKSVKSRNGEGEGVFLGTSYGLMSFPKNYFDIAAIIAFEQLFSFPDYRTCERAFQIFHSLIARLKENGFLIVQTRNCKERLLSDILNPPSFYKRALKERESCFFPPFCNIVALRIFNNEEIAKKKYGEIKEKFASLPGLIIFPPFRSLAKKRGRYPYIILLKLPPGQRLHNLLTPDDLLIKDKGIEVDISPMTCLT